MGIDCSATLTLTRHTGLADLGKKLKLYKDGCSGLEADLTGEWDPDLTSDSCLSFPNPAPAHTG